MKRLILAISTATAFTTSVHAVVVVERQNERVYYAHLVDTITKTDYESLVEKVAAIQGKATVFYVLNSSGGNVEASLQIGRFLRKRKALAFVRQSAICMSSCVFILAGAAHRDIKGAVGIHRPYEPNDTDSSAEAQKVKYSKLGNSVRAFLSEMNVQPKLYDDMLYVPPDKVRVLSDKDLASYGLVQDDPYEDEANAADRAKRVGVSREEYAVRQVRIRNECPRITDNSSYKEQQAFAHCYDDIEAGRR